jgi:hypothetical protein
VTARDHEARTAEITDVGEIDETTITAAQRTAAHFAENAQELALFMKMLGIHPSQEDRCHHGAPASTATPRPLRGAFHNAPAIPSTPPRILRAPPEVRAGDFGKRTRIVNDPKGRRV